MASDNYERMPEESLFDFMTRLASQRVSGILGGGGMMASKPSTASVNPALTVTAAAPTNLGTVVPNTQSNNATTQTRVSSGQPLLDKNGKPVMGRNGPVMGTVVVNDPAKTQTYRDAVNIAANTAVMPSDALTGIKEAAALSGTPLGLGVSLGSSLLGWGLDSLAEKEAIDTMAANLGIEKNSLAYDALKNEVAVELAKNSGWLGFNQNVSQDNMTDVAKMALESGLSIEQAAKNFAKDKIREIYGDISQKDEIDAAMLHEAAVRAGMFSDAMAGMTHPASNIVDRNPITGSGIAIINGVPRTYSPGLLDTNTSVVGQIFSPAITTPANQYSGFDFSVGGGALPTQDEEARVLEYGLDALYSDSNTSSNSNSSPSNDFSGPDKTGGMGGAWI